MSTRAYVTGPLIPKEQIANLVRILLVYLTFKNKAFCINYDQYSKAYKILQAV